MKNEIVFTDARTPAQRAATNAEFPYGCVCGEQYTNVRSAQLCRKCRTYLSEEDNTGWVVDLRTGTVVVEGRQPEAEWVAPDWLTLD